MKKTPGKTPAAKEKYWTKIIDQARKYPKGITEFCRAMNISKNNYYFWFKRLRPKHPEWHDLSNHPEAIVYLRQPKNKNGTSPAAPPATEVPVRAQRKKFSAADRERILKETDGLSAGDLASALRREGLYVHTLNKWRTQRDLTNIAVRRASGAPNPLSAENRKLREENERLQKKLQQASDIIQIQKKISQMLTMTLDATEEQ
jgi:transposase